jgi:glucosamine--fructose-6-phosphate aminotransferase (isomerizing)
MQSRGVSATAIDTAELLHYRGGYCIPGTAVLLASRSGESVESVRLLPLLKQRGAAIIAVTNEPDSTLAREADLVLPINSPPDEMVAVQTYVATVATMLLLDGAITPADLVTLSRALPDWIETWLAGVEHIGDRLDPSRPVYVLGRGPSLASAHEGALLFGETAKHPAIGMNAAQFRHGPVEVVDAAYQAILFGSQRNTADVDASLATDLVGLGGKVVAINQRCPAWPRQVSDVLTPIIEIVPVQVAAVRLAERKGFVPGVFRTATLVTSEEAGFASSSDA